ncbi:MAG: hypothetical protein K9J85_06515 [Desulfobacteraceae bacterium]|nr:hypothetical protein [Desulfobacteraceae bacterium]
MKQLTPEEKKRLLSEAFWDKNIDTARLYDLLTGKAGQAHEIDKKSVFSRLLSTYDWFTLMKLIPEDLLPEALSDEVISRLYPKQLRDKYAYARRILFK